MPTDDPQGAIGLLPAFQAGLYLALWTAALGGGSRLRTGLGLAVLGLTQVPGLRALQAGVSYTGSTVQVRDVRRWAIAAPLLICAVVARHARPPH